MNTKITRYESESDYTSDKLVAALSDVSLVPSVDGLLKLTRLLERGLPPSSALHPQAAVPLGETRHRLQKLHLQRPQETLHLLQSLAVLGARRAFVQYLRAVGNLCIYFLSFFIFI